MNATPPDPSQNISKWGKIGAYGGALIGFLGWVIGFAILCIATDNVDALAEFLLPAFLLSFSMGLVAILIMEAVVRLCGPATPTFFLALWGLLFFFGGVLTLLINVWIAPIIDHHPEMVADLQRMNSVYRVNGHLPTFLLMAGAVALGAAALAIFKAPPSKN